MTVTSNESHLTTISAHNWDKHLARSYGAKLGHVFLLSGNVGDIYPWGTEFITLRQYWARMTANLDVAVFWDKASGFVFADELFKTDRPDKKPMREAFREIAFQVDPSVATDKSAAAFLAGIRKVADVLPTDPIEVFELFEKLLRSGKRVSVIIDYVESVIPENDYTSPIVVKLQRWASADSPLLDTTNPVILIERNLERCSRIIKQDDSCVIRYHIPRPSREELLDFVTVTLGVYKEKKLLLERGLTPVVIANLMAGLRCQDFKDFCLMAMHEKIPIDTSFIWTKKTVLIERQSDGLLQVVRPKHGFESLGGIDHILGSLRIQIDNLKRGLPTTDKGWLIMGPPGTGKTIAVEAIAKESGVSMLALRNIYDKFVGSSERNLTLAMDIALAMAPAVIFIDEAAEAVGSGKEYAGDSGVSNRVRGMLQNKMGDERLRGKIFFALVTNYPNRLPPPLLRDGRMDKRVPFLLPDDDDRMAILKILGGKYGADDDDEIDYSTAIPLTKGWSGAELNGLMLRARQFAEEQNSDLNTMMLIQALGDYIPSHDDKAYRLMELLAIQYTNSRQFLPPRFGGYTKENVAKEIAALTMAMQQEEAMLLQS